MDCGCGSSKHKCQVNTCKERHSYWTCSSCGSFTCVKHQVFVGVIISSCSLRKCRSKKIEYCITCGKPE